MSGDDAKAAVDTARAELREMTKPGVVTDHEASMAAAQQITVHRFACFAESKEVYPTTYPPPEAGDGVDVFKACDEAGEGMCTRKEIAKYLMRNQTLRHRLREGWQKFNENFGTEDTPENHEELSQEQFCKLWAEAAALRQEQTSEGNGTEKKSKQWGVWGTAAEEGELAPEGQEYGLGEASQKRADSSRQAELLDDLKTEVVEKGEIITGPDGYEYPPLTDAAITVLRRYWSGELPKHREQNVIQWEQRVRSAKQLQLAVPQPPKIPAAELLNRAVAQKSTAHDEDIAKWTIADESADESPEFREFQEKGIVPETVSRMLQDREDARQARDFAKADRIRGDIFRMQVEFHDGLRQWRSPDGQSGSWGSGPAAAPGAGPTAGPPSDRPRELQDIDLPGTWEDFLRLPDPKVLAVGPQQSTGKRAWGCGGSNWGNHDEQSAVQQAIDNCREQGVNNPKIIWPPHRAAVIRDKGGKGWGKGGGHDKGYGKGGYGSYEKGGYGGHDGKGYGEKGGYGGHDGKGYGDRGGYGHDGKGYGDRGGYGDRYGGEKGGYDKGGHGEKGGYGPPGGMPVARPAQQYGGMGQDYGMRYAPR
eukprot:TRINITY_DN783_c0_g1_i1.p1 TRINITY_DN783_c0_g1~~TRINITY_DN783_c0_g1_i1.p1  ORF type:complete len:618 (+),score=213.42 TRINITY_DN783_c0_g1_i1:84-1856(+)